MSASVPPNILGSDVEIKGSIKFQADLSVDGKIDGEITSPAALIVGEHAEIHGEIRTRSVTVQGNVQANITVEDRCELKAGSRLTGDLKAARLIIEDGATFIGRSEVTPKGVKIPPPMPPQPEKPQ